MRGAKKALFLEPYRLEENPFSPDRLHPVHRSLSYEYSARKIAQLVDGKLHCLFISGPAGVGKSLLLEKELSSVDSVDICRIDPGQKDAQSILTQLLTDIGPGPVAGSASELRNILHVFLRHQAARGRRCLIVADSVDRESLAIIREIEALVQMRLRGIPAVHALMTTRNEELVAQFQSRNEAGMRIGWQHQRHTGFTLEETEAYLRSSLLGAGCEWFEELIPGELVFEIQSFTQGIVGDIDNLMREAMEQLARASSGSIRQQSLDVGILKAAAKKLRLRYDAAAWKIQHEEVLLPSAIRQSRREALRIEAATLSVSSGGKMVAEISLNRPRMVLGRDDSCDISLDSSYVSRYQNLFMATNEGWMLIDLNSTNGCFVNGRKVSEHKLRDGDLITLGQHHIRFSGHPMDYGSKDSSATMTTPARALN
jgi:type II secretory pathway predicted ATPase ExeA